MKNDDLLSGPEQPSPAPPETNSPRLNPDLTSLERVRGARPGNAYTRIKRVPAFHKVGPGHFEATTKAELPLSTSGRILRTIRRFFIGQPLFTNEEGTQRLGVFKGLAVFGADAISSSAYATEAALFVLVTAGSMAAGKVLGVGIAIAAVFAVVIFSYRQLVFAYPQGGGAYNVTRANFGRIPSLVVASALLIDYVLTVAVSIVAGSLAITSALSVAGFDQQVSALTVALPGFLNPTVILTLLFIGLMVLANLRGVQESGTIFAIPAYLFIFGAVSLIIVGLIKYASGTLAPAMPPPVLPVVAPLGLWLLLRAFSSGAVAMSGTEAIADSVPAFKSPESKNAAKTLVLMALVLVVFFLGISFLSSKMGLVPGQQTIISQTALAVFGDGFIYYVFQIATMAILVIAANTAFAGFPRLASVLAADSFMPRQFLYRDDRLAFSNGIFVLGSAAAALVILFKGNIENLIHLYAIGVFLAFAMSNMGMVAHWWHNRQKGWRFSLAVNATGTIVTATILLIIIATKFTVGGWVVLVLIPMILISLLFIRRHYDRVGQQLRVQPGHLPPPTVSQLIILPIDDVNYASLRAMSFARTIKADIVVLHVSTNPERAAKIQHKMKDYAPDLKLVIIDAMTPAFIPPLVAYVEAIHHQSPVALVTIVLPEFITAHWWESFLHNRTAPRLHRVFEKHPNVAVVVVPYLLER